MTPRIDSRNTETDSVPETYRSHVTDALEQTTEQTTEYGKPANKPRRFSETGITKEKHETETIQKPGRLSLDDICEDCDMDRTVGFKSRHQYSQALSGQGKAVAQKTPRKASELFTPREKGLSKGNGSVTPRKQSHRLSLPKLS